MRASACLLAGALLAAGPVAAADPAAWLVKATEASRAATYQGVVVYRDARTMEVLRLVHRQKDGEVQERLTSLTGQPRDLVRQGDRLACLVAGEPTAATGGLPQTLFPAFTTAVLERVAQHYQLSDSGEARVAGRSCRSVAMAPRDEFRYGYEICADNATGVPLRVTLTDRKGRTVEQLLFTEVAFPATIADSAFELPPGARMVPRDQEAMAAAAPASWTLNRLPPGFEVIMRSVMSANGEGEVQHVLLSDGLSAVSVFGAPQAAAGEALKGLSRMGAMNAYGRTAGAYHVTVVGEVPEGTVRLIGDGFSPQTPATSAP